MKRSHCSFPPIKSSPSSATLSQPSAFSLSLFLSLYPSELHLRLYCSISPSTCCATFDLFNWPSIRPFGRRFCPQTTTTPRLAGSRQSPLSLATLRSSSPDQLVPLRPSLLFYYSPFTTPFNPRFSHFKSRKESKKMAAVLPASANNVTTPVKTPGIAKPVKQAQPVRKVRWVELSISIVDWNGGTKGGEAKGTMTWGERASDTNRTMQGGRRARVF